MTLEKIEITSLLKAFEKFENFRKNLETEQEKAGAIQAFEYCYELAWKTMKRLLAVQGKDVNFPRATFRAAALAGLIEDPEIWFEFLIRLGERYAGLEKTIIDSTHNIENDEAKIIAILPEFAQELSLFIKKIDLACPAEL